MNTYLILKIIAFVTMVIDHYGNLVSNDLCRIIGRVSFPLFCLFVAYGCKKTKHPLKRIIKLLACAIISQPIYYWLFNDNNLNIIFGYALFAFTLYALDKLNLKNIILEVMLMILCALTCETYSIDYGWFLIALCYIFYKCKNEYVAGVCFMITLVINALINSNFISFINKETYAVISLPLILTFYVKENKSEIKRKIYNNKVMNFLSRNIFYILYPLHLLVLGLLFK